MGKFKKIISNTNCLSSKLHLRISNELITIDCVKAMTTKGKFSFEFFIVSHVLMCDTRKAKEYKNKLIEV